MLLIVTTTIMLSAVMLAASLVPSSLVMTRAFALVNWVPYDDVPSQEFTIAGWSNKVDQRIIS